MPKLSKEQSRDITAFHLVCKLFPKIDFLKMAYSKCGYFEHFISSALNLGVNNSIQISEQNMQ